MGSEKRARQKANRAKKMAEMEVEETKEQREVATKKWGRIAAVVGVIVAVFVLFNVLTGGDDGPLLRATSAEPTTVAGPAEIVLADSVPDDFEPFSGTRALAGVVPSARADVYSSPPPMTIDTAKTYIATLDTDVGSIAVELFPAAAPVTVNNFVNLARDGFYDGIVFHRVLDGFMAQGGDPTGTGTGGPGYQFEDEVDNGLSFDKIGLLAMANAGPATNGSQFFITFDVAATAGLTGRHTIFGEVVRNPELLDEILRVDPGSGNPETVINAVRIVES